MTEAQGAVLALLAERGAGKTICPSEVARRIAEAGQDWRGSMEQVHAAVDRLVAAGAVTLSWKGEIIDARRGPYRIARR